MMTHWRSIAVVGLSALLGFVAAAAAFTDHPVEGLKLRLVRQGSSAKLVFVSRDPSFLFPTIGGADDPAAGGALVEIYSPGEGWWSMALPAGAGRPGWTATAGARPRYRFVNPAAPSGISLARSALLKQGKFLKIVVADTRQPQQVPQGSIGIRVTTGTLRNCALFGPATILRDVVADFRASHAPASALPDCSDVSLGDMSGGCEASPFPTCGGTCPGDGVCTIGLGVCQCVSPSSPCGGTSPLCSGTCPGGEECAAVGPGPLPDCVCLPIGSTPCGTPGAPVCGGDCPAGDVCRPGYALPSLGGALGCSCAPPNPCGEMGGLDCGNGFACALLPPSTYTCAPISCGGSPTYPACGGSCVSGATCTAFSDPSFTGCVCEVGP